MCHIRATCANVIHCMSNSWESTKWKWIVAAPIPQSNGFIQPMNIGLSRSIYGWIHPTWCLCVILQNLYEQTNLHDGLSHLNLIIVGTINMGTNILWLVVDLPLWKIWASWDDDIPNWMESHKSHVPVTTKQFWYLNPFMGIRTDYRPRHITHAVLRRIGITSPVHRAT